MDLFFRKPGTLKVERSNYNNCNLDLFKVIFYFVPWELREHFSHFPSIFSKSKVNNSKKTH